jgi:hypothetical protein
MAMAEIARERPPSVLCRSSGGPILGSAPATASRQAALDQARALVQSSGTALEPRVHGWASRRFGMDFGDVRIHACAEAAASAKALHAQAYALGSHIVFGHGAYAPDSRAGRRLLAHELAHVAQQGDAIRRKSISPDPEIELGGNNDREEREAEAIADAVTRDDDEAHGGIAAPAVGTARPALRRMPLHDDHDVAWPEKAEAECIRRVPPDPAECDPGRPLTWADFARRPGRSSFSAATWSGLRRRAMNTAALQCLPAERVAGLPGEGLQAHFDPARSWVKPQFVDPNIACAPQIAACRTAFSRPDTAWWALSSAAVGGCAASARARGDRATSAAQCDTVVASDCRDRADAESARLLAHEQGHFNIACAVARKANAIHRPGADLDVLLRAARATLRRAQRSYDSQTGHGCNAGAQSRWEADIARGLPDFEIVLPRRRTRR